MAIERKKYNLIISEHPQSMAFNRGGMWGLSPKKKSSHLYCSICGYKVKGKNHNKGKHHMQSPGYIRMIKERKVKAL